MNILLIAFASMFVIVASTYQNEGSINLKSLCKYNQTDHTCWIDKESGHGTLEREMSGYICMQHSDLTKIVNRIKELKSQK